jgi:hypothetical protein
VTERTREDELREVPLWKANKAAWPPGVRSVGIDEADCLGIDRSGNLYWDGKPVEVRRFALTFWQKVWGGIVAASVVVSAIGAGVQGWTAYNDWACTVGWWAVTCAPD